MFAKIALLFPPFATLTYGLPRYFPDGFWKVGMRAAIPLGKQIRCGYIVSIDEKSDLPPETACKNILWPLEREPILNEELLALANDLSARQAAPLGSVFGHMLPTELKSGDFRFRKGAEIFDLERIMALDEDWRVRLATALVKGEGEFEARRRNSSAEEALEVKIDPPWPVRPAAKRQIALLDFLHEKGFATRRQLAQNFGAGYADALNKLLAAGYVGFLDEVEREIAPIEVADFALTAEQKKALDAFESALNSEEAECRLLYGVTGSGKTAVYLELIKKCLASGKSVFLLAPEIALAHKLFADAARVFPRGIPRLYHGYQFSGARSDLFRGLAATREASLIVGARSALFLPVHTPGLIILDEEHDASFKQDEGFPYHAKEVAWFRMQKNRGALILGSATPDIKTFYSARSGQIPVSILSSRVSGRALPPVELVNIGAGTGKISPGTIQAGAEGVGLLAPESEKALIECLDRGEQAVVLLNRRGYAPMIYCLDCAKVLRCPHCEIGLSYHKSSKKLMCHYCGYSAPYPSPCPDCHRANFLPIGEGTEKIAERLETIAGREILRMDRDSARRKGKVDEILEDFRANRSPILVGTQMLSKGHHFPNVTLAIVADGDIGLNLPDYRAAERTFQLLVQAGGRAGRGQKAGRALIQTRNVNHYCWKYVLNSDYEGFYEEELARRRKKLYPPFVKLAILRFSFPRADEAAFAAVQETRAFVRKEGARLGVAALGPVPSPIPLLRGMRRFQCLLKAQDWKNIRALYFKIISRPAPARLKIFLDLDPVNML
ncbi:MAG: primosomal protein N' [Desulfovibrio sp.]|nr:primosomal protein N' [Desulfovibrio sp.]